MQTGTSTPRPTVAHALERALRRDGRDPAAVESAAAPHLVPPRYFAPGEYAGEQDWWAKQLKKR